MDDRPDGSDSSASPSSRNIVSVSSTNTTDSLTNSRSSSSYFPFSSELSMCYCLESAGVILQTLPDLSQVHMAGTESKFYTFTPFACPIMLAGYTFLMLRQKAENYGSPTGIKAGKSSLLSECERGAASCMEVLDGFSQAWMHLEDAASKLMGFCLPRLPT